MFGYVRPLIPQLLVRELDDYKAVYCGLCRTMGKRHGLIARFALNYDFTFLAMVLAWDEDPCRMTRRRCVAHPLCKRKCCEEMPALAVAADESMILSYQKLRDDVADSGFFAGLPARAASLLLRRAYKKAAKAAPQFDAAVSACLSELQRMEKDHCPSLDRPADAFARILQAAAPDTGDQARNRALSQLLYHVGRWIYLVDAWDDLEKDEKSGSYNPIHARYEGRGKEHREDIRLTLAHSRNLAASAYELAKAPRWDGVLTNILYSGMPAVEELVLSGRWNRPKNLGE